MWRPTKLTQKLLDSFQEVLGSEENALICTDEELLFLLNEKLDEKERISEDSFQRYKAWKLKDNEDLIKSFCGLYKRALLKEKVNLMRNLKTTDSAWQRYAWIIERKFDEWNLKAKQDIDMNAKVNAKVVLLPPLRDNGGEGNITKA